MEIGKSLKGSSGKSARSVYESVSIKVWGLVWDSVEDSLKLSVRNLLSNSVEDSVGNSTRGSIKNITNGIR